MVERKNPPDIAVSSGAFPAYGQRALEAAYKKMKEKMSMKVKRIYYNDDDILIPGHLIIRRFRKPVFYPFGNKCGFSYETIHNEELLIEYSRESYRRFYKDTYPEGTRVLLVEMGNDPRPVPAMTKGTVDSVDDAPIIHCKFDNGRCLGIIPGVDAFRKISKDI